LKFSRIRRINIKACIISFIIGFIFAFTSIFLLDNNSAIIPLLKDVDKLEIILFYILLITVVVAQEMVWRFGIYLPIAAYLLYPKTGYRSCSKASTGWPVTIIIAILWSFVHYPFLDSIGACLFGSLFGIALNSIVLRSQSKIPSIVCNLTFWFIIINCS